MNNELAYVSATELLAYYRAGSLSPVEVVTALLDRIAAMNPRINALYFVNADGAIAAAKASEEPWRRGEPKVFSTGFQ